MSQPILPRCLSFLVLGFALGWLPIANAAGKSPSPIQDEVVADDDDSINEQTIYVPYDKLKTVFEKSGRGVFLPYEKFQQLWREARRHQPEPVDTTAPLGALITEIENIARLGDQIVTVDAVIQVELLRKGWHRIPLRLGDAAIRSARIGNREARILSDDNGGYVLLAQHDADEPATLKLELSYAKAQVKTGGQSSVAFQSPQAPVNRWTILTSEDDVEVEIEPMIASSRRSFQPTGTNGSTQDTGAEILAFVGAAPEVRIRWTPKAEGASGLAALISAETRVTAHIDEGVTRTSALVACDISRATVNNLQLLVPADQKVVNVFDRNVKRWDVQTEGDRHTISIELFEPAQGRQNLAVELEKFYEQTDTVSIGIPQFEVVDASRHQGMVLVALASGLRGEPEKKSGLLQVDKAEIPAEIAAQDWRFAYRFAAVPIDLTLKVDKIQPLIHAHQLVEVTLQPDALTADVSLFYDIQKAGVFQLVLEIPADLELRDVHELAANDTTGVAVDSYYRDADSETRWLVNLGSKAMGRVGLALSLRREINDANLLKPADTAATIALTVPQVASDTVEFATGYLVVYASESLEVTANSLQSLRSESFQNALGSHSQIDHLSKLRPILAYAFSDAAASLDLNVKRRKPQVAVDQLMVVSLQNGVVQYDARLFYNVRYSGVPSFRLDVPTELVGQLRNRSTQISHQPIDPPPADLREGYTAWQLTGESEFFGSHEIHWTWESKLDELPLGESRDFAVPKLVPMLVDRASGQIVTTKSETIDVQPEAGAVGLRPIDPKTDLIGGRQIENAAVAFEFVDDWSLDLIATRFELEDLKRTSIPRALVRVVALRQDRLSVQALYQVRSVDQRLAIQMPPGFEAATSFDDQPVTINGRRIAPERGGDDLIYVPLTEHESNQTLLLDLRYTIPGSKRNIDLPSFPQNPAVQKVYVCVYLPHEEALYAQSGNWSDQAMQWAVGGPNAEQQRGVGFDWKRMFQPREVDVNAYLNWVHQDVQCDPAASSKFETDGRPYIFAAVQPQAPPVGSLHLRSINRTFLNSIFCVALVGVGVVFLRRGLNQQLIAFILVVAATVVLGIFFPLITEHLVGEVLLACLAVIILLWLVFDIGQTSRHLIASRQRAQAATEQQSSAAPAETAATESQSSEDSGSEENDAN